MSKYIICMTEPTANHLKYYIGKGAAYQYGGERYAVLSTVPSDAKRYSSLARDKAAYNRMYGSCVNIDFADDFVEYIEVIE